MKYQNRIVIDPEIMHGKPVIKGSRIPVYIVLNLLAGGLKPKEVLGEYPDLANEDILACLEYAAELAQEELGILDIERVNVDIKEMAITELNDPKEAKLRNIIDMGLAFSAMIRLFEQGSKSELYKEILDQVRKLFTAESKGHFKEIHSSFCSWGITHIILAEKKSKGQVIKKAGPASYGQIAKTFDVVLKVAVYYCHLPNCEKSQQISRWLNAALDTKMIEMLKQYYPEDIASWPATIEQVDNSTYISTQEIVHKFIADRHNGNIIPVQFDDIYWRALNRQQV